MLAVITKFKLTALLLMAGVAGASATGPFISLSTTDVSVGTAKATETLTDSVTIYNLGDSTLSITNVVTGCRCTSVALPHPLQRPRLAHAPLHLGHHSPRPQALIRAYPQAGHAQHHQSEVDGFAADILLAEEQRSAQERN